LESVLVLPLACLASPAWADDAVADSAGSDIVVTAARSVLPASALPLTVDVVGAEELAQQAAISGSVVDAVSTLTPSFSPTRQKLSGAGETLRGRSPLYAINGIPQSTPLRDGSRDGFTIDPFFVDRVELIFGSNALQGIGATGGVVNQVTVGAPKVEGLSGRALVQGTADDGFRSDGLGGKVAGLLSWKSGRFDATAGAAFEKRGAFYDGRGRRIGVDSTQGEIQDSDTLSLFGRFGYELGDSARLDLILSRFELKGDGDYVTVINSADRARRIPTIAVRGDPPGVPAANLTETASLSLTDPDLGGGNFVAQIFFNRSRDTFGGDPSPIGTFQDPRIAPADTLFDQSQNRSRKIGGKVSYERALPGIPGLTAIAGVDALIDRTEQRLIATGRTWVPPTEFRSLAPFGQLNLALLDGKLRLAGGARWENVQIKVDDYQTLASTTFNGRDIATYGGVAVAGGKPTFEDVLVNGGVIVEPWAGIRAYASYAEGFTVPDVGRITRAVSRTGVDIDNFLDISPIVSNNRELGVEVKRGPLDASVAYFWSSSDKGQLLVLNAGVFDVQRLRVEIQGIEVNLGVDTPIPGLRVSAGYAHIDGRYDSDTPADGKVDTDLDGANISPDRLNLAANYVRGPFTARLQSQFYRGRSFRGKKRVPENDFEGYAIADAYLGYDTGKGRLTFAVQNLFDRQYIDYSSDTTRAGDRSRFFAGRGRTFTLGWDYRF
jgi:iron complex outermembrane receptor protein